MVPKFGNFENKSEIPGKFSNVLLEKDEDRLARSFEKQSVTKSQEGLSYKQ